MARAEVPLFGGRVTDGIVRLGDTVRRPVSGDRSCVHELLHHLERQDFDGAPRLIGIDDENCEILSFLPGDVPDDLDHFYDEQLTTAGGLLRRFHDATTDLPLVRDSGAEVMCHNDWGPPNAVFRNGLPLWNNRLRYDRAGRRLWDLGYSAFTWLDLGNPDYSGDEQIRRLSVFAAGYGLKSCTIDQIAAYAVARQTTLAVSGRSQGKTEMTEWAAAAANWTVLNVTKRLLPDGY